MEQVGQLIKEIEQSNFKKVDTSRVEANTASQALGGQTIPRDADPTVATMYVVLLMARKLIERGA